MLLIAAAIATVIAVQHRDIAYTGVTVWALVAIAFKQWNNPLLRNLAIGLALAIALVVVIQNSRTPHSIS